MAGPRAQARRWRDLARRVPGLRRGYRAARAAWWRSKDAALVVWSELLALVRGPDTEKHRISEVWGECAATRTSEEEWRAAGWLGMKEVLWSYVFPFFGGQDWYQYLRDRYCTPSRALALSLCCGNGSVERDFIRYGLCQAAEGIDISEEAVKVCLRAAQAEGMSDRLAYQVADIERAKLRRKRYDLVVAWMALHHLRRLSHVYREVGRSLRPGGILVVNEYVGPTRFQLPDEQVALIDSLLQEVPEELRRLRTGGMKQHFSRQSPLEMARRDPSEAVRSSRILPVLRRHFVIVECIEYGGAVLNWLLQGISQNFDPDNSEHAALLERLFEAERRALASGRFRSDFAFVIARRADEHAR